MRRLGAATLLALLAAALLAAPVSAHPLGNFTVNRFSGLHLRGATVQVQYVVDYAEIPAFQEKQRLDADPAYLDHSVASLASNLRLTLDGRPAPLDLVSRSRAFLAGAGGLQTLRVQLVLRSAEIGPGTKRATYKDLNYPERLGWKEIVVDAADGAALESSTAPARSISDQLRTYPQDRLTSPLNQTTAEFSFSPGIGSGGTLAPVNAGGAFNALRDRFTGLILTRDFSLPAIALALLIAAGLGALHALEPGHGKSVMAGYLVGTRGRRRDALVLGLSITLTHTAGVFILGLVTLYAATFVTPERLYPWLTLISGLVIVVIGGNLLLARARTAFGQRAGAVAGHGHDHEPEHPHDHAYDNEHDHDHGHSHGPAVAGSPLKLGNLLALGASGGLLPCPSALVVLLAAIAYHRLAFGIVLIIAFSSGLAIVLSGLGVALATGGRAVSRAFGAMPSVSRARFAAALPMVSALVITAAGVGLSIQALGGLG